MQYPLGKILYMPLQNVVVGSSSNAPTCSEVQLCIGSCVLALARLLGLVTAVGSRHSAPADIQAGG